MAVRRATIGEFLRNMRKGYTDYSLRQFADRLDFSASFLSDLERDNRVVSRKFLLRWVKEILPDHWQQPNIYDTALDLAGLMSAERQCLIELYEYFDCRSGGDHHDSVCVKIHDALYGELYPCRKVAELGVPVDVPCQESGGKGKGL